MRYSPKFFVVYLVLKLQGQVLSEVAKMGMQLNRLSKLKMDCCIHLKRASSFCQSLPPSFYMKRYPFLLWFKVILFHSCAAVSLLNLLKYSCPSMAYAHLLHTYNMQIEFVEFERHGAGGASISSHYFDLLVKLKNDQEHLFRNIQRSEYHNLFNFIKYVAFYWLCYHIFYIYTTCWWFFLFFGKYFKWKTLENNEPWRWSRRNWWGYSCSTRHWWWCCWSTSRTN